MKKNIDLVIDGIVPEKVMYDTDNHSLVVLYPAQEEFKKGDIVIHDNTKRVSIFDSYENKYSRFNAIFSIDSCKNKYSGFNAIFSIDRAGNIDYNRSWNTDTLRYATSSEIEKFDNDLKEIGKKWNRETLQVEGLDISEIVYNLSSACSYLSKPIPDFSSLLLTISNEDFHKYKAQITLQLIREAWNKFDGFEVDWKNTAQQKYYPQVYVLDEYKNKISTANWITYASADSSCYYFESRERAKQFGNQFKELFKTAMGI